MMGTYHQHTMKKRKMDAVYQIQLTLLVFVTCFCLMAKGDISCYCNEAPCKAKGYTCSSQLGGCYSQFKYNSNVSLHGCLDLLAEGDQRLCNGEGDIIQTRNGRGPHEWPILMCCKDNMCNYIESTDINIYINGKNSNSSKSLSDDNEGDDVNWNPKRSHVGHQGYTREDMWFRVAVIAVPIAGGFILVILVLCAVRMLRGDQSRRHHQRLMELSRRHQSFTKAQLYVTDHFTQTDKDISKLKNKSCDIGRQSRKNSIYKDLSIKLDGGDKIKKGANEGNNSGCASVLIWGADDTKGGISLV